MTGDELLDLLATEGDSNDYNDEIGGYVSWSIGRDTGVPVLAVKFEDYMVDADEPVTHEARWALLPVADNIGKIEVVSTSPAEEPCTVCGVAGGHNECLIPSTQQKGQFRG